MFTELIISGGSTNFMAMLGALEVLYEHNMHIHFKRYIGTSIGSILCFLLAIGYTPSFIQRITLESDFSKFHEITCDNVLSFFDNLGIISGEKIMALLKVFMKVKGINEHITFRDFKDQFGKSLYFTTWCLQDKTTVCMSYHNHPDMEVLLAIRMSISIPFMFRPVQWMSKTYIDGGIIDNLPVRFSRNKKSSIAININIDTPVRDPLDITNYINLIVRSVAKEITTQKKRLCRHPMIIELEIPDNPIINFDLSSETKKELFEIGRRQATEFLQRHSGK